MLLQENNKKITPLLNFKIWNHSFNFIKETLMKWLETHKKDLKISWQINLKSPLDSRMKTLHLWDIHNMELLRHQVSNNHQDHLPTIKLIKTKHHKINLLLSQIIWIHLELVKTLSPHKNQITLETLICLMELTMLMSLFKFKIGCQRTNYKRSNRTATLIMLKC